MSDIFQFPFNRLQYAGLNNPRWVSDLVCANQQTLSGLTAIAGLGPNDFAIFGGLELTVPISGPDFYTPGVFYLKGVWYYMPNDFDQGFYLAPNLTGAQNYTFSDVVVRPTYQINLAQTSSSPTGNTPIFNGNMNQYRMDIKTIFAILQNLQLTASVVSVLPASYTVTFTNDQSISFSSATVNTTIHFDFTNAIPGTVVTLEWTFATSLTLSIPPTTGQTIWLESGSQSNVGSATNILTMLYVGIDATGNPQVRLNLSQPTVTT
jgi:hypothetical protein